MTKRITTSLVAVLVLTTSAFAAEQESATPSVQTETNSHANGYYIGLGYGMTAFNDGDFGQEFDNFKVSPDTDTDSGFKVYGGYKFNKIVCK